MLEEIKYRLYNSEKFQEIKSKVGNNLYIGGISGSLSSFLIDYILNEVSKKIVYLSNDTEKLRKVFDDLTAISHLDNVGVLITQDPLISSEISKSLLLLLESQKYIVLSNISEFECIPIRMEQFRDSIIKLRKNDEYLFDELILKLQSNFYERQGKVEGIGQFSVRGGIIDVFPENLDFPVRIEFIGEEIESIREFDIITQRSIREIDEVSISINLQSEEFSEKKFETDTLEQYIPSDTILIIDDINTFNDSVYLSLAEHLSSAFTTIFFSYINDTGIKNSVNFNSQPQPDFRSNISLLYRNLIEYFARAYDVYILSSDENQSKKIRSIIEDFESDNFKEENRKLRKVIDVEIFRKTPSRTSIKQSAINYLSESIQNGFILHNNKLLVYTEHEIFRRYFRQPKRQRKKFTGISIEDLKTLSVGDYVVHRDFGIGIYSGLKEIDIGGRKQEVVKLTYAGGDTLFVNLNYVNLIRKFSANEGVIPKLTHLGGNDWDRIKQKTKNKVKDIARDLILLYAKRKKQKGYKFSTDTHWQKELEASFMYEDTPDQVRATEEVKIDMESENPMDRLICGDVGFGKTEIAIRAAFKAVLDNKQVAVLVPTTILAVQHFNTFRDRLSPFAVEIDFLTRLKTKKEQEEILTLLQSGKIDIIIGTHRLLSPDVKFKDLGLLIIDEEQRFGVKDKEKLRALKPNIDTLTLTATPIPRTLNFSLLGARDLSIINTPPQNRKPIITEVIKLDWQLIAEAIFNELKRQGQVYFVTDRIADLYRIADKISELLPQARVGVAHGQMNARKLEDVIIDFIEQKIEVLVCTKIIESGLDIPNVNTIIINNANMYGLAEIYQLRGRVGRSEQQAYAYLISPPAGKLTKSAIRRLQAIEEYTELGSGFNLALRDMEIRGVGNLLGKEQSGFISQIGFDTFLDIIDEAVLELKESEFTELFNKDKTLKIAEAAVKEKYTLTTIIENDIDAYIPFEYISDDTEKLAIYKRLYEIKDINNLVELKNELIDRYGKYDLPVESLLKIIELKILATKLGIEKIIINGLNAYIYFTVTENHITIDDEFFNSLIKKMSSSPLSDYCKFLNDTKSLVLQFNFSSEDDRERIKELEKLLRLQL
ncbi:MAG: transcription-repair coupling factor [Ignavibacteria bacterium]